VNRATSHEASSAFAAHSFRRRVTDLKYLSTEPVDEPVDKPSNHDLFISHHNTLLCLHYYLAVAMHLKSLDELKVIGRTTGFLIAAAGHSVSVEGYPAKASLPIKSGHFSLHNAWSPIIEAPKHHLDARKRGRPCTFDL
jgi:hypothetical protein